MDEFYIYWVMNSDVTLMNSLFLRWERDNTPIAAFPGKYEWAGDRTQGDCSLRILNANFDYDNGGWVCQVFARYIFECLVKTVASAPQTKKLTIAFFQVTASSFRERDTLISQAANLVVRGKFSKEIFLAILLFCGMYVPLRFVNFSIHHVMGLGMTISINQAHTDDGGSERAKYYYQLMVFKVKVLSASFITFIGNWTQWGTRLLRCSSMHFSNQSLLQYCE